MVRQLVTAAAVCIALSSQANAAELKPTKVTVLARENAVVIERALVGDGELLVPVDNVEAVTSFKIKPEGMCVDDLCIPIPADAGWLTEQAGAKYFNLTKFAAKVDQVYAVDAENNVWSFTAVPRAQTAPLMAGQAPDFELPDRNGKTVRLSDFRGKKVLIVTWASWCGCRLDLPGWENVYKDLKDKNFELISVAEDTGGPAVANPWYEKANVSFPATVDTKHTISSLYQMVNVPSGVWIDETGKIVRPAEVAYSHQQKALNQAIGDDRYAQGVRDWVEKGSKSEFVVAPDKLAKKLALRDSKLRLADAHFKIGAYFSEQKNRELATKHWQEAQKLNPDSWNYHRQDWSFDKSKEMSNFLGKVRALNGRPYYDPVEFPAGITPEKPQ